MPSLQPKIKHYFNRAKLPQTRMNSAYYKDPPGRVPFFGAAASLIFSALFRPKFAQSRCERPQSVFLRQKRPLKRIRSRIAEAEISAFSATEIFLVFCFAAFFACAKYGVGFGYFGIRLNTPSRLRFCAARNALRFFLSGMRSPSCGASRPALTHQSASQSQSAIVSQLSTISSAMPKGSSRPFIASIQSDSVISPIAPFSAPAFAHAYSSRTRRSA